MLTNESSKTDQRGINWKIMEQLCEITGGHRWLYSFWERRCLLCLRHESESQPQIYKTEEKWIYKRKKTSKARLSFELEEKTEEICMIIGHKREKVGA